MWVGVFGCVCVSWVVIGRNRGESKQEGFVRMSCTYINTYTHAHTHTHTGGGEIPLRGDGHRVSRCGGKACGGRDSSGLPI